MALRVSKTINLGHGLKLHVGKRGLGLSAGIPGVRVGVNSKGRSHVTLGIPGTGVSFRAAAGGERKPGLRTTRIAIARALGGKQSAFVQGLTALVTQGPLQARPHFARAPDRTSTAFLLAYCESFDDALHQRAIARLRVILQDPTKELPDALLDRYIVDAHVAIDITPAVRVDVPVSRLAVSLLLTELLQTRDLAGAIDTLEHATDRTPPLVASLAELYALGERWHDVVAITDEIRNTDDLTAQTLVHRARALAALGMHGPAIEALREALTTRRRSLPVLVAARYERALIYEAMGEQRKARRDFESVVAADADYRDVAERLAAPATASASKETPPVSWQVREARRRARLTQAELAARAGVSAKTVARIETGDVVPRDDTVERLLRACAAPEVGR